MKSLYVIIQVPYSVKFCVTELKVYDTLSIMFYVFILPIKLLVTFCTGELFIIVVDCIFVSIKIVFPWEGLKTYIALELHDQNDSKCSMIGFLELPLDMH